MTGTLRNPAVLALSIVAISVVALFSMAPLAHAAAMPGYGPRVPVGPQASITCPAGSVMLSPTDAVQTIVTAHAAGTSYCFTPGTYSGQAIKPHAGDTYTGQVGAILDGGGTTPKAFAASVANVTIQNLVIQNYNPGSQLAAVSNTNNESGSNWIVKNNDIQNNNGAGVGIQNGSQMIANYLYKNAMEGYVCHGSGDVLTDNEIADNNPTWAFSPDFEAGGGKCTVSTGALVEYNYAHDNNGPGLWTDLDNQGTVYQYNDVENNAGAGIFHEVSWDAVIANNYVKNNGTKSTSGNCNGWLWCGDIQIAASGGVSGKIIDVYGNTVISSSAVNGNNIVLIQQNRGSGTFGTHLVQNVHVHNNTIDLTAGGSAGAATDNGFTVMFSTAGNSFQNDTYIGVGSHSLSWNGGTGNLAWFQTQSQETGASTTTPPPVTTPAAPTVTISATPSSVTTGTSASIMWSSTNATSCTGTGFTANGISGTVSVSPTLNTTYSISCTSAGGSANHSITVTVTALADTTAPSSPLNLAGTAVSASQINLTWGASTNNVGVTGYQVFRGGALIASPSTNSYSDTGLTASTAYSYTVLAKDAAGNGSAQSSAVTVTTQAAAINPTNPTNPITPPAATATLSVSATSITSGQPVNLTWSSANATSCAGTGFTPSGTSGMVTVFPTGNTTYSINCSGGMASAVVMVAAMTPPVTSTTTTTGTSFAIGATIQTTERLNVHSTSSVRDWWVCTQPRGAHGTIVGGPVKAFGYTWWNINYSSGCNGWSVQDYLVLAPMTTTTTAGGSSTTSTTADVQAQINQLLAELAVLRSELAAIEASMQH